MNIQYTNYKSLDLRTWQEAFATEDVDFDAIQFYIDSLMVFIERVDTNRYCENHHIFPMCIDANKSFTNEKVLINGSDHFRAHILLSKCFSGVNRQRLCSASHRMLSNIKRDSSKPLPEEYEEEKRLFVESQSGENSFWYGKTIYNDGSRNFYFTSDQIPPSNLVRGRAPIGCKYNNGSIERCFFDGDEIPSGFLRGAISYGKCYNNGIVEKYFKDNEEIPKEFIVGKLKSSTAGRVAINNGTITRYIEQNEQIPDGFVRGILIGSVVCNNGIKDIRVNTIDDVPQGYVVGSVRKNKKTHCYSNGTSIKFFGEDDTIPCGYVRKCVSRPTRGGTYYNDGIHNKLVKCGETPPAGYVMGKTSIGGTSNTKCYTNGVSNRYIKIGDPIPDGYVLGRCKKIRNNEVINDARRDKE